MSQQMIHNYTLSSEYGLPPLDPENLARLGRTLLLIVAGDGKISEKEFEAFMDLGRRVGATQEILTNMQAWDWKGARIEDHLPMGLSNGWKLIVLYEGIRVASADGEFHAGERAKMYQAAQALGVSQATVAAVEALASAEIGLQAARVNLFAQA